MAGRIRELRMAVNSAVRSATPEVNRRQNPRVQVNQNAAVELGDHVIEANLADLSLCGGRLTGVPENVEGRDGKLRLDGVREKVPFHVVEMTDGTARLRFADKGAPAAELSRFIAERARTRAERARTERGAA
jgi:methyl-accepting chemotaxis protein